MSYDYRVIVHDDVCNCQYCVKEREKALFAGADSRILAHQGSMLIQQEKKQQMSELEKRTLTPAKSLEVMRWVLDPTAVPSDHPTRLNQDRIIAKSASAEENKPTCQREINQRLLEVQKMILGD